ncbi:PAS domain S-box protein [Leptospira ognonensis]|uniref:PAS domain S-box protein n=1 Tax=Leptospira ognonensis TaxID=2484945 RepID=UPI0014385A41|nr:PAS domain S-box protein [Leptospira ognonensis]
MNYYKTILYVEDEALIAMLTKRQLQQEGYEVIHVFSGEEAIETMQKGPAIDLILMDIDLGTGMDGTVAAEQILADSDIPLLFLSSHTEKEVVEKTESITNYGYVVKASSFTVLDASIKMAFKLFAAKADIQSQRMEIEASYEEMQATNTMLIENQLLLGQSEEKYRNLYEANVLPISIFEPNSLKYLSVNQAFADKYGYSREEFLQMTILEIRPDNPEEISRVRASVSQKKQGVASIGIFTHQKRNGETMQVEIIKSDVIFDGKQAIMVVVNDVSERQKAEKLLLEAKMQAELSNLSLQGFKFALDEHALVSITNPEGKITYVNEKFCNVSKYSPEELLGKDHRIINSGHHPKEFFHGLWKNLKNKEVWRGEIKNRAKDGSYYWVQSTIVPLLDLDGNPNQFIAIRTDITEQKKLPELSP